MFHCEPFFVEWRPTEILSLFSYVILALLHRIATGVKWYPANLKGYKIVNTSRILISRMDAEFILVYIDTNISMKQQELAEKWQFF